MKTHKNMKNYRVTKVELMSQPTMVSPNRLYEFVFRAAHEDVTLQFDDINTIKGFRENCLVSFEHLPSDRTGDINFDRELAATSFGAFVETLGPRDKGLLRRAVWKLSEPGKKALLKAGN